MAYDPDYHKEYYNRNKDKKVVAAVAWQEENREAHNAAVARYAERNPEVALEAGKRYRDKVRHTIGYKQRNMVTRAKRRAKEGGYPCTITVDDVAAAWAPDNRCPVFGFEFDLTGEDLQRTPSLDKINPELGYIPGNIVVVSYRANSIKQDSTLDELRVLLEYYTGLLNP